MNLKRTLLCLSMLAISLPSFALTRTEANNIVINQIIQNHPAMNELIAYSYDPFGTANMLHIGDTIGEFIPSFTHVLTADSWLFWLDLAPGNWFEHPTMIVLVNDADSSIMTFSTTWFPVVNGLHLYSSFEERTFSPDIIWGDPELPPGNCGDTATVDTGGTGSSPTAWAVLATGPAGHPVADKDVKLMEDALKNNKTGPGVPAGNFSKPKGTKKAICDALDALAQQNPPCDKIFFHYTGHGTKDFLVLGHPFNLANEKITWQELVNKLKATKAKSFCISIESCQSGGGKATLEAGLGGEGVTSADDTKPAGLTRDGSIFTKAFAACMTDANADTGGDGKVSYTEAKDWAKAQCGDTNAQNPMGWMTTTSLPKLPFLTDLALYPNPVHGSATLRFELPQATPVQLTLRNTLGQVVYRRQLPLLKGLRKIPLDLSGLARGHYSLVLRSERGQDVVKLTILE